MAIFNSYVKLPEGIYIYIYHSNVRVYRRVTSGTSFILWPRFSVKTCGIPKMPLKWSVLWQNQCQARIPQASKVCFSRKSPRFIPENCIYINNYIYTYNYIHIYIYNYIYTYISRCIHNHAPDRTNHLLVQHSKLENHIVQELNHLSMGPWFPCSKLFNYQTIRLCQWGIDQWKPTSHKLLCQVVD